MCPSPRGPGRGQAGASEPLGRAGWTSPFLLCLAAPPLWGLQEAGSEHCTHQLCSSKQSWTLKVKETPRPLFPVHASPRPLSCLPPHPNKSQSLTPLNHACPLFSSLPTTLCPPPSPSNLSEPQALLLSPEVHFSPFFLFL